jgi:DNA-binding SARP family transcriptional activator/predicted negative regulator of RcsB-dependent stress response
VADGRGLEIGLLGEFSAAHDGSLLELGGPRQRAVLAMLVIGRGRLVSAEQLVDNLWDDDDRPANEFASLQSYISHLRRRLEPDAAARSRSGVIVRQAHGYAVRLAPDAVDAWRFEQLLASDGGDVVQRLTDALAMWRGAPLADYADRPWAQPEIVRLDELRSVARERLAQARVDRGEAAVLVGELEAMVAEAPLREERWRMLALALYLANRQADALTALRRARTTFADELGVDPGPALRALESDILAQAPSLQARASAPTAFVPTAALVMERTADDLVERDAEIAQLRQALARLEAGQPTGVLVEGPAGIGKTRLLDELSRQAGERGVRVLIARASPLERSFGYGIVRQLLEPAINDDMLCAAAAPARAVFDLAAEHTEGSLAVLHALYAVTAQLASQGALLLSVDNLQWADAPSLRYLGYVARRISGVPIMIAATMRTGEADEIAELVAELAWDTDTLLLRPQPLTEQATSHLVERACGQPAAGLFVAACHRTTSGNPLLLRQLLQALVTAAVKPDASHAQAVLAVGSRAVSSQVLLRLRRMPEPCRRVARSVAVLGEAAQLPHVAALSGLPEAETAAAVATLTRGEILRDEHTLGFVHPIVAEAIYRDVPSVERGLEHERAAALLSSRGASAEQVSAHLMLAPTRSDPATVRTLRAAAGCAADRGAVDSAVAYLRRALDEPPDATMRPLVLLELGMQEALIDGRAGAERLRAAYERVDDPQTQVRIATAIAQTQVFASERGAAITFARDAIRRLPEGMDDARDGLTALLRIGGIMQALDPALWRDDLQQPTGTGAGAQMLRATLAWEAMLAGTDREHAVRLAREATADDRLWHGDTGLLWCIAAAARMYAEDDLGDFWLRTRTAAHARGSLFAVLAVNQWEGVWRWRRGELAEAKALISEAHEQDRMWGGSGVGLAYSYGALVAIDLDRGDLAGARALLDAAPDGARHGDGGRLLRLAGARVLVGEARFAEALRTLDEITDPVGVVNPAFNPWRRVRAAALAGLGRSDEAVALVEEEVGLLRAWGAPSPLGLSLTDLGRATGRREHFAESVALLKNTDAAYALSRARLALATHPDTPAPEAITLLREALDGAVSCGAHRVAGRACAALRRHGVDVPDPPAHTPGPSATQQRVAALAAQGMDVAEISQALFLTPQTVQALLGELAVR